MGESIQKQLLRVRPPRVKITYDVETGGAIEKRELPFIVGIFADLSADRKDAATFPAYKERRMVDIDRDCFNDVMKASEPTVSLGKVLNPADGKAFGGAITFSALDDFLPINVIKAVPVLNARYTARSRIRSVQATAECNDTLARMFDKLISDDGKNDQAALIKAFDPTKPDDWGKVDVKPAKPTDDQADFAAKMLGQLVGVDATDAAVLEGGRNLIGAFVAEIVTDLGNAKPEELNKGVALLIDIRVSKIDSELSTQLSVIMHAPNFQQIEATWRGLFYLVSKTETGRLLKLRVFNAQKVELLKDMQKAVEFDQSLLFKMIYEAEYGTYGGTPYSLLLGGYEFGRSFEDTEFLKKITEVAGAAHAPFITAASADLFGFDYYDKLAKPRDLAKIFESISLQSWNEFRQMEDSRYVTLVMPHALLRLPYGEKTMPAEGLNFNEDVGGSDNTKFLWGNATYMLAQRITSAFAMYSWTAAIRGVEGGGLVEGLPLYRYADADGMPQLFCPTEVEITDRREKELNDLGFISLCHCKGTSNAAFFGGQTTNLPKKYISDEANANARISAMLPYILAASRFAHYIKVMVRDKIGSFQTRETVESYLNSWIAQYVLLDDGASQEVKASYPLRAAKVVVTDVPGQPGAYRATVFLKPHFQLEELTTSIRLVAELPA
ncbi:MAG: type VI secretion system contractile sheath large subunit [Betaproteobacteria bacterium]|nr:type VI secretion system contractile sheath large subunit [Betaproteobacteria bacterium]